jgi:hypothetical protein
MLILPPLETLTSLVIMAWSGAATAKNEAMNFCKYCVTPKNPNFCEICRNLSFHDGLHLGGIYLDLSSTITYPKYTKEC